MVLEYQFLDRNQYRYLQATQPLTHLGSRFTVLAIASSAPPFHVPIHYDFFSDD
ncbi:MAG: hypothetical protein AAFR31_13280 [Cyanobacteria bacterium J06627_8]